MTLATDVNLEEFVMSKDELTGADIKVHMGVTGNIISIYMLLLSQWRLFLGRLHPILTLL